MGTSETKIKTKIAYLVAPGPSIDTYDWSKVSSYIMAINYSGLALPRYDSVVALDMHVIALRKYPKNTLLYTRRCSARMKKHFNINMMHSDILQANSFTSSYGFYILYTLGYNTIHAIGFDSRMNGALEHASTLSDYYGVTRYTKNNIESYNNTIDSTIEILQTRARSMSTFFNILWE